MHASDILFKKCADSKSIYTTYLQSVVAVSEQGFEEISELIARFDNLRDSNKDLLAQVQEVKIDDMLKNSLKVLIRIHLFCICSKKIEWASSAPEYKP
jgi:hypothetical protein